MRVVLGVAGYVFAIFMVPSGSGWCQEPGLGIPSLEELLNTKVVAATRLPVGARRSPGILTVLLRKEIVASGAKDLMGILRTVPGLDFASDTQGVVGIGVRSNWGHDGKVLLLIDGHEMNEPLYGTLQFGGHYPIEDIQRIEIMRGPGSVIYGGYAELAVINVITRRGWDINGVAGTFWLGGASGAETARTQGHLSYGRAWGESDFSLSYTRARAPQGVGLWLTNEGTPLQSGDISGINQDFLNMKFSRGNLNLRYLRDAYSLRDYTQEFKATTWDLKFPAEFFSVDYELALGDWSLKPRFSIKEQRPWLYTDARTDRNTRTLGSLLATWSAPVPLQISMGLEGSQDNSNIFWSSKGYRQTYVYQNRAGLFQALWSPGFGNLDLGLRYDHNSEFGKAVSPRLAFTKVAPDWHFKLLAAGAFRAPSIENLFSNPDLKPERTVTYEAEVGHALSLNSYLSANFFFVRVHEPISYANSAPGVNNYYNFDYIGSKGLELDLKTHTSDFDLHSTLSLSGADDRNAYFYRVAERPSYHMGFPNVKFSSLAQWRFRADWSLNPSLLILGPRYGYRFGETRASHFDTTVLLNLFLTYSFSKDVEAGFSVSNITNSATSYIQAYGFPDVGGNPPLPTLGRELDIRLNFRF